MAKYRKNPEKQAGKGVAEVEASEQKKQGLESQKIEKIRKRVLLVCLVFSVILGIDWLYADQFFTQTSIFVREVGHKGKVLELFLLLAAIVVWAALIFVHFTFVKESSAQAVMRFGAFNRMLFSKRNHRLLREGEQRRDRDGNIMAGPYDMVRESGYRYAIGPFDLGGLRIYWPILGESIYWYSWIWIKSLPDGSLEFKGPETVNYILVGQDYTYGMEIKGNDVVDKAGVPVELTLAFTGQIINPRKALFEATRWFDVFMARIEPPIRAFVNTHSYEEMLAMKERGRLDEQIFEDLRTSPDERAAGRIDIVETLRDNYGFKLSAIQCRRFSVEGDYQESLTQQWKARRDAERRMESTVGAMTRMLAGMIKIGDEKLEDAEKRVRAEFDRLIRTDPTVREKLLDMSKDLVDQQLAADAKGQSALKRYYFQGGSAGMDLVALLGETLGEALKKAISGGGETKPSSGSSDSSASDSGSESGGSADASESKKKTKEEWRKEAKRLEAERIERAREAEKKKGKK